jgi:hypothetical protein
MKKRGVNTKPASITQVQRVNVDLSGVTDRVRRLERRPGYSVEVVSALPSSPYDGQVVMFQTAAMLSAGIAWVFRYQAAGGSYPWKLVGGGAWVERVATAETTTSTSYTNLATVGPDITLPLAGRYIASYGTAQDYSAITTNRVAYASLSVGGATPADTDSVRSGHPNVANLIQSVATQDVVTIAAASTLVRVQYRTGGDTARFRSRYLSLIPIEVSA